MLKIKQYIKNNKELEQELINERKESENTKNKLYTENDKLIDERKQLKQQLKEKEEDFVVSKQQHKNKMIELQKNLEQYIKNNKELEQEFKKIEEDFIISKKHLIDAHNTIEDYNNSLQNKDNIIREFTENMKTIKQNSTSMQPRQRERIKLPTRTQLPQKRDMRGGNINSVKLQNLKDKAEYLNYKIKYLLLKHYDVKTL
jgi:chromosome segregation ATPase